MRHLSHIDVSDNRIDVLEDCAWLTRCQFINVSCNRLFVLPLLLETNVKLVHMDASENRLSPETLPCFHSGLRHLDLRGNEEIRDIEDALDAIGLVNAPMMFSAGPFE
jgi:hypothetical protein